MKQRPSIAWASGSGACCPSQHPAAAIQGPWSRASRAAAATATAAGRRRAAVACRPHCRPCLLRCSSGSSEDLYSKLKTLQRQLEFLEIQVRGRRGPPASGWEGGMRRWRHVHASPFSVYLAESVLLLLLPLPVPLEQEEYIKEEQKNLKNELLRAQEEVKRIQVSTAETSSFQRCVGAASMLCCRSLCC